LRANGFEPAQPSALLAEGLRIYLPADAQAQVFTGIDSLASPGSHVAVEEGEPMDPTDFEVAKQRGEAGGIRGSAWSKTRRRRTPPSGSATAVGTLSLPR
jgi:O-methyltransferase involved in polyketide biosynthesis